MAAVGYVLMGFPRVSETFIASEIQRVEQAGISVRLFVIKPVEEREAELRHPVVERIEARPEYLPDTTALTAPLHRWRPRHLAAVRPRAEAHAALPAHRRGPGVRHGASDRRCATAGRRSPARARST